MIAYVRGDILLDDAEALVNTVNCVGVMGRGVALQFKRRFPENFKAYKAACERGEVQPGRMFVFDTGQLTHPRYIINFPTKRHWRSDSRMGDIDAGLVALVETIRERGITSIAVPPLGSGNGGLRWENVRPRIEQALATLTDIEITIYEPTTSAVAQLPSVGHRVSITPGRAALVGLMHRYLSGAMSNDVSLLEVHKLMYFMQEAGQPLKLQYVEGLYGPYAENLRHVLIAVEGQLVIGYGDGGDEPTRVLQILPGAVEQAEAALAANVEMRCRFERVLDLVSGFESPFALELLATVHWVASHGDVSDIDAVVRQTWAWGTRKQQFKDWQIELVYDTLRTKGWLEPSSAMT